MKTTVLYEGLVSSSIHGCRIFLFFSKHPLRKYLWHFFLFKMSLNARNKQTEMWTQTRATEQNEQKWCLRWLRPLQLGKTPFSLVIFALLTRSVMKWDGQLLCTLWISDLSSSNIYTHRPTRQTPGESSFWNLGGKVLRVRVEKLL